MLVEPIFENIEKAGYKGHVASCEHGDTISAGWTSVKSSLLEKRRNAHRGSLKLKAQDDDPALSTPVLPGSMVDFGEEKPTWVLSKLPTDVVDESKLPPSRQECGHFTKNPEIITDLINTLANQR